MHSNENNLFDFYRLIGSGKHAKWNTHEGYEVVSGRGGSWPQIIFNVEPGGTSGIAIADIFSDVVLSGDVRHALCNRILFIHNDQELLRSRKIFPVTYWKLMEIIRTSNCDTASEGIRQLTTLTHCEAIDDFVTLLNKDMMKDQKAKQELFYELSEKSNVELFGLYQEDKLVSGLLAFTDNNNVSGLYFIVTGSEYRGKGLAAGVVQEVLDILFQRGIKKVVLQSMPKAVTLYSRLGFESKGELVILWKQ